MKHIIFASLLIGALIGASPVCADDTHEHGVADLRVVSDGATLEIELVSPLDTLVGFEHVPRTEAQRTIVSDAERRLRDAEGLWLLSPDAKCVLKNVAVESPWAQEGRDHPVKEHEEDDGHRHDPEHASAPFEGHAERVASYRFECAAPDKLTRLQTRLFDAFPRLRELRAQHATAKGQGAATLKPAAPELFL